MQPLSIAVIGSGIAGLSAAWLLSSKHQVTVFEANAYAGGHSNTIDVENCPVDTGFIVYNPPNYPNLCALFKHLDVATMPAPMTFSASLEDGAYEYSGTRASGLFGQISNIGDLQHWRMLQNLLRFFREAPLAAAGLPDNLPLGDFLRDGGYSEAFVRRHLLPMAGAIWSAPADQMMAYPAKAFIRFFDNHGLLKVSNRPQWRTVKGGSRSYVERILADGRFRLELNRPVAAVRRYPGHVEITSSEGGSRTFDHVVLATHADQSLRLLHAPCDEEAELLGAFRYTHNLAVVHTDREFMPRRRRLWSSWNYVERGPTSNALTATYWMNALQSLPISKNVFVTLNPAREPDPGSEIARMDYRHPLFNAAALRAQRQLWALQGQQRTWFCGSYFGAGFHEDALQSGLAVAEELGSVARPWSVSSPSARIYRAPQPADYMDAAE